jgi:diguanylate cyclase (GGDEF)-like protein
MVQGNGPCIAPASKRVSAYASAPIGQQVSIAAYVGLPLTKPDGTLFGTLCAIDPEIQSETLLDALPQLELISRMLGTILASELRAEAEMRRAERAEAEAETDSLTGLYNRRGWDRLLAAEESRCRRYGHVASVISVDLDEFKKINDLQGHSIGDKMLANAARALKDATRDSDVVARVGGDEFAVLAIHCDQPQANQLVARMLEHLSNFSISASIGMASRNPAKSLGDAWIEADQNMYEFKRNRKRTPIDEFANESTSGGTTDASELPIQGLPSQQGVGRVSHCIGRDFQVRAQ